MEEEKRTEETEKIREMQVDAVESRHSIRECAIRRKKGWKLMKMKWNYSWEKLVVKERHIILEKEGK